MIANRFETPLSILVGVQCFFLIALSRNEAFSQEPSSNRRMPLVAMVPEGVTAHREIAYVENGHERQKFDLYVPDKRDAPLPLIIWVHGGGWANGSKDGCPPLRNGYTNRGYAVASINYRLSGHAVFPAQIEDCKAAIRSLRANAAEYGIDPKRFGVWGSSAGGHLVALLGTSGDVKEFDVGGQLEQSSRVQAVCDYYGPTDFSVFVTTPGYESHARAESPEAKLIGGAVLDNPDRAKRVNPITFVTSDDPPFLIVHGDKDSTVPINQSQLLFESLKKSGVQSHFHTIKGAGHGSGFGGPEIAPLVNAFFDQHLKSNLIAPKGESKTSESIASTETRPSTPSPVVQKAETRRGPGLSFDAIISRTDTNKDGKLSREEFRGPAPMFDRLDANRDGLVTLEEHERAFPPRTDGSPANPRTPSAEKPNEPISKESDLNEESRSTLPAPSNSNIAYGPYERNILDFWQVKSEKPTPIAVFIHGGGFIGGSKEQLNARELKALLDAGISVAAINYRLLAQAPLPAAHQDATRAVQFLRSKAVEWNLDKSRFGGFGGSAGAQLVMYLAFHDELAMPDSADPVARESSRLACAAPTSGQITMDMNWWDKNVPHYSEKAQRRRSNRELFGTNDEMEAMKINADIAAISLISKGDPPVFMSYSMSPDNELPTDDRAASSWMIHHVIHGIELKKICNRFDVESHLKYPGATSTYGTTVDFFRAKLIEIEQHSKPTRAVTAQDAPRKPLLSRPSAQADSSTAVWAEAKAEPDGMKYCTFSSEVVGTNVSYLIYLPPDYETATSQRYPVVYWLHGRGGSQTGASQLVRRLDPAIRAGKASPMIVVGINGLRTSSFVDSADGKTPVQTVIVQELIPHVDSTYRTIASRDGRAIEGFSMGGAGAPKIGFKHPELFSVVSIFAGALHDLESYKSRGTAFQDIYGGKDDYFESNSPWKLAERNAQAIRGNTAIRIVVGDKDGLLERNTAFHQLLDELKITHEFTVVPDATHSPGPLYDGIGDQTWSFYQREFGLSDSLR